MARSLPSILNLPAFHAISVCFAVNFVFDGEVETGIAFPIVVLKNMSKNFNQRLEQIGLATAILANQNVDKAVAVEAQGKIPEVLYWLIVSEISGAWQFLP